VGSHQRIGRHPGRLLGRFGSLAFEYLNLPFQPRNFPLLLFDLPRLLFVFFLKLKTLRLQTPLLGGLSFATSE
jgi:hypothetical protein